jgi:predicted TIM-barrel fold metal-dependent hydrolase
MEAAMITDAQVHLFPPDTADRPWPTDGGRGAPKVPYYLAEQMIGAMDAVGVDRAVIVPPVWAGDHNDYAFEVCKTYPGRFKIMGRLDPWAADSPQRLETWLQQPDMLGIRMSSRWGTREEPFGQMLKDGSLGWFWEACARLGIPLKLLTRDAIGAVHDIASANPSLTIIIDHMSTMDAPTVEGAFAHLDTLLEVSRHANVNVQISTAPNYSRQPYPFEDVQPVLRRIHDAYGAGRMLWAADITQLTRGKNTYAECLRLWQEGLPFLSASDRDRILGGTAAELLKWPEE